MLLLTQIQGCIPQNYLIALATPCSVAYFATIAFCSMLALSMIHDTDVQYQEMTNFPNRR